jgi:hypothetical protein
MKTRRGPFHGATPAEDSALVSAGAEYRLANGVNSFNPCSSIGLRSQQ